MFPFIIVLIGLYLFFSLTYQVSKHLLPGYSPYDTQRIVELLFLELSAIGLLFASKKTWQVSFYTMPRNIRIGLVIILILGLLSSLQAPLPKMAYLELSLFVLLFFLIITVASQRIIFGELFDYQLIKLLIFFAVLYSILVFKQMLIIHLINVPASHITNNFFPGFANIRFFSQYQLWSLFLVTVPLFSLNRKSMPYYIVLIVALLWWTLAWIDGSKSVRVSIGLALLCIIFLFRAKVIKWLIAHLLIMFIGYLFYKLLLSQATSIHTVTSLNSSTSARETLWLYTWQLIKAHPLLGLGPMHFAYYINLIAAHPHNALLQFAVEWGVPVALLLVGIIIYSILTWVKSLLSAESVPVLSLALLATLIAEFCNSMMDGVIVTPMSQVMMAIIIGWSYGVYRAAYRQEIKQTARDYFLLLLRAIMVASSAGIVIGVLPVLSHLSQNEIIWYLQQNPSKPFYPRFWLQGWIGKP